MQQLLEHAAAHPNSTLVALGVVWAVGYLLACAVYPYKTCDWCKGGKHHSPSGKAHRKCFRCGGSKRVLRLGRRLWPHER